MCVCVCDRASYDKITCQKGQGTDKGLDHLEHSERKESETEINRKIATEKDKHNKEGENNICTQN